MSKRDAIQIDLDMLLRLGIDPRCAIEYLERKKALEMNPVHIKILQLLKEQLALASS